MHIEYGSGRILGLVKNDRVCVSDVNCVCDSVVQFGGDASVLCSTQQGFTCATAEPSLASLDTN